MPWSASSGATKKARTIESPTSPAAAAASTGTGIFGAELFGDDVLKGRPAQYREDRVVQTEKREIAHRFGRDAGADAPTTSGIASGRKSSGRISSRVRLAAAIAASSVPTAQMPMFASRTPRTASVPSGEKKSANAGSATSSIAARKTKTAADFPSQIALRSDGASTSPLERPALAFRRPRTRQAQQRGEHERDPEQPLRRNLVGTRRQREVKTTSVERTKSSIAGSVSRAPSSSRDPCARAWRRRRDRSCQRQTEVASGSTRRGRASRAGSWPRR
jgi:hypothetical protein